MPEHSADVVIVGAGTAGSAAAALCAKRGMRVICVDRKPLDRAGAHWVNDVTEGTFAAAGLPEPPASEQVAHSRAFHLVAGYGPARVEVRNSRLVELDMKALVARLHRLAAEQGAQLHGEVLVDRLDGGVLETSIGALRASTFVDASGLTGANLLHQDPVAKTDLCTAAQALFDVRDHAGAEAFFRRYNTPLGEQLCFTSVAGGYSILRVVCDGEHVGLLTGSIPALGFPSGRAILRRFVADHRAWIGDERVSGARAIPVRRARARLARDRVAAIGDAACQVFPQHGSGIGAGLLAAALLAETLAKGSTPHDYARAWQRRHGGTFAAYDLFRRFSQSLTVPELSGMIRSGLMDASLVSAGLQQELPCLTPMTILAKLGAGLRAPKLAARLIALGPRTTRILAHYARYPKNPRQVDAWARKEARVFGAV